MTKLAANLTMMFNEFEFLDRFAGAAEAGFEAVEFLFPYDYAPYQIARRLYDYRLTQALFNAPPGNWDRGDRGLAALAGREAKFRESIECVLPYADATGVKRVHVMAGIADPNNATSKKTFCDNIAWAAARFEEQNITLMLEPINRRDMPGYFLNDFDFAGEIISEIDTANVRLQFDVYHRQILHGDVTVALEQFIELIDHVQIASVPGRHEPDEGELNYRNVFATLTRLGYDGWIGCEYRPRRGTLAGLTWRESLLD